MNSVERKEYVQESKLAKQGKVLGKNEVLGRRTMITPQRNSILEKPKRKRDKK